MHLTPVLLRRREVWLPTWRGVLLLSALAVIVGAVLCLKAYDLLAPQQPARGPNGDGARTLVVEGWLEADDLQQAIARVRASHYARVLTTGGPVINWPGGGQWSSYAARAADYLRANGVTDIPVIAVEAPASAQERTYLSAVMVREWAQHAGVRLEAIDLYSAGVHARRSWIAYRMALGDEVEVGVLAAAPTEFDPRRWWTSSAGAKSTLGEAVSVLWTKCCFWPAPRGSHEERWAVPAVAPP